MDKLARVKVDARLQGIIQELQADPTSHPNFQLVDSLLLYKGGLYLPKGSTLIPLLLHDGSIGGHSGFLKTYKKVATNVCW